MHGKTHAIVSLAVVNAGVAATVATNYAPKTLAAVHEVSAPPAYILSAVTLTAAILFLCRVGYRIGRKRLMLFWMGLVIAGLFSLSIFFPTSGPASFTLALLVFMIGALAPDIDTESSELGRYVKPISTRLTHRTVTHTIWIVLLLAVASWFFHSSYLFAFTFGYTLHIIEDTFSRQGICWFYPILGSYDRFSGGAAIKHGRKPLFFYYRTGKASEQIVFYAALAVHALCAFLIVTH